jgi:hypothetical protein
MKNYQSDKACVCCGLIGDGMTCYHHLLTQKSHPELKENKRNMISVCQNHHNMFHSRGIDYMATKFPLVKDWLMNNGWEYNSFLQKWILEIKD